MHLLNACTRACNAVKLGTSFLGFISNIASPNSIKPITFRTDSTSSD